MVLLRHQLPTRVGTFGGLVCVLVGLLLAIPPLVTLLAGAMQPLTRWFSVEARLAADNLLRAPGRTGVVIGAMASSAAVMPQKAGGRRSNREPDAGWL